MKPIITVSLCETEPGGHATVVEGRMLSDREAFLAMAELLAGLRQAAINMLIGNGNDPQLAETSVDAAARTFRAVTAAGETTIAKRRVQAGSAPTDEIPDEYL